MRTYLQLVNDVLVRLRESTVSTVSQTPYSTLIGAFINDAKREVEDAWQWSQLFDYLSFATLPGISSYETNAMITRYAAPPISASNGCSDRTRLWLEPDEEIPILFNTTLNFESRLTYEPTLSGWQQKLQMINKPVLNVPSTWQLSQSTFYTVPGQWNKAVQLWDYPDITYIMQLWVVNPQQDLQADSDVMKIPASPVVQKARLFALYERGEEIGPSLTQIGQQVEDAISDAISNDMAQQKISLNLVVPYGGAY